MKKIFCVLGIFFIFISCAKLPVPCQIQDSWIIDKPFDQIWQTTLETLAEIDFKLAAPLEKASGLISTETRDFPKTQKDYWDYGSLAFTQFKEGYRGKLTIFIKKQDNSQTELRIVSKFNVLFTDTTHEALTKSRLERAVQGEDLFSRPCISTGKLEFEIYQLIMEKLKYER